MKQFLFVLLLGLGLVGLSACSSANSPADNPTNLSEAAATFPISQNTSLSDGVYKISSADSIFIWQAEKIIGTGHVGTVAVKSGEINISGGALSGGSFVIDMNSINNNEGIEGLTKHLKGADFFSVDIYPEARFVVTKVDPTAEAGVFSVDGELTIKDKTAPLNLSVKLSQNGNGLEATSSFNIDRTKWDLRYGSGKFLDNLGDKAIRDEINFNFVLKADR